MPKAGITVESCILTKWNVKVGDTVKVGDVMFSYETDKSSFDYQAEIDGEVLALFCEEGDEVPVLSNVAAVGAKGDDPSPLNPNAQAVAAAPAAVEVKAAAPVATAAPVAAAVANADGRIFASPRAKNLAVKLGVDLASAVGTGPNGRIIERDVREASVAPKAVVEEVKAAPAPAAAPAPKAEPTPAAAPEEKKGGFFSFFRGKK
jgi:pyruvate dehydrogenase E2 component (dihydrolipoamide acetyltransferase)